MPPEIKTVTVRLGEAPYATSVEAGRHRFVSDVEAAKGGADAGPDPHELMLASLAACTVMTVKMYADRKGWPIETLEADASHEAVRSDGGPAHRFVIDLRMTGSLDEEQRARLIDIAHRCPVHRAFAEAKTIEIRA